ncbi:unnamed protein product [Staurois parvus]|uniref:Sleeping Beauty transposase HTH domain-containing protein n=1 Tax=Staurois parvus TaxID=386267 RepID=A0ABN9DR02_9NEOB|nr:unnamed protein product [Staurois parvus]
MQTASTNICERMGRSQELSDSKRGPVIGCHLCNKSLRDISWLPNIPRSTVSGIITKWKQLGTTVQPQSSKMTERGQRMLKHTVRRSHQLSAESIAKDLQTWCGLQPTVCRELHGWVSMSSCISIGGGQRMQHTCQLWCKARRPLDFRAVETCSLE